MLTLDVSSDPQYKQSLLILNVDTVDTADLKLDDPDLLSLGFGLQWAKLH